VAQRAGLMFQSSHVKIPVRGVIENMSWFTGDDGTRYELFGAGGGAPAGRAPRRAADRPGPLVPNYGRRRHRPADLRRRARLRARPSLRLDREWIDHHKPTRRRSAALKVG